MNTIKIETAGGGFVITVNEFSAMANREIHIASTKEVLFLVVRALLERLYKDK